MASSGSRAAATSACVTRDHDRRILHRHKKETQGSSVEVSRKYARPRERLGILRRDTKQPSYGALARAMSNERLEALKVSVSASWSSPHAQPFFRRGR